MSAKARNFLESITAYADDAEGSKRSWERPVKVGTIDPAHTDGRPMVLFDGETIMGVKRYPWIGTPPRAGTRVVLIPQGRGYVIAGALDETAGGGLPVGTSLDGHWVAAPPGFFPEDGRQLAIASYPQLFAVLGRRYNTGGETSTMFRIPDSRGRANVGLGAGRFTGLGGTTGAETHALTVHELAKHNHGVGGAGTGTAKAVYNYQDIVGGGSIAFVNPRSGAAMLTGAYIDDNGGGGAHNNVQPSITITRVIKY